MALIAQGVNLATAKARRARPSLGLTTTRYEAVRCTGHRGWWQRDGVSLLCECGGVRGGCRAASASKPLSPLVVPPDLTVTLTGHAPGDDPKPPWPGPTGLDINISAARRGREQPMNEHESSNSRPPDGERMQETFKAFVKADIDWDGDPGVLDELTDLLTEMLNAGGVPPEGHKLAVVFGEVVPV